MFLTMMKLFSVLPRDGPYITGDKPTYQFGDWINLNCTSAKSYPASSLHWYIHNLSVSKNIHIEMHSLF